MNSPRSPSKSRTASPRRRFGKEDNVISASIRKVARLCRQDTPRTSTATSTRGRVVRSSWRRPYTTLTPFSSAATSSEHQFNLDRFVSAQAPVYATVLRELTAGKKRSHWMWFVFPQHQDLGHSETARYYGIGSREEASAYLHHPLLGPRLRECVEAVLRHKGVQPIEIFGGIDNIKLRSCLTLFDAVSATDEDLFRRALDQFYEGYKDEATLKLIRN